MLTHETWWEQNPARDAELRDWLTKHDDDRAVIGAIADGTGAQSVLECGPGLYLDHERVWAQRPHVAYQAVDVTPRFVTAGRARGLTVTEGSIEALPLASRSVDLAYCRDVLEHLPHWAPALSELLRVASATVCVRLFRLSPSAQDDVIAFDTVAAARGLHHNTYAQAGIEAFLRRHGVTRWTWTGYRAHRAEPSVGVCWLTVDVRGVTPPLTPA
jgi:SAM-dependent methyltransferase